MTFLANRKRLPLVVALALLMVSSQLATAQRPFPDCYILSAGVDRYPNEPQLSGDDNDARNATRAFVAQQGKLFGRVYSRTLLDAQAKHANILKQMKDFALLGKAGDFFVVFLSGHGGVYNDGHTWYFCPFDESPNNNDGDLPQGEILDCADVLVRQGKKVVIIIDACFSGRLVDAVQPQFKRYAGLKTEGGLILALSSGPKQESQALGEYSAFAKSFVDGLAGGADASRTGRVTLAGLRSYTYRRTYQLLSQHKNNARQDSTIVWSPNLSANMPLALLSKMALPAEVVSKATVWTGSETRAGKGGRLTFNTYPGGQAVKIDAKGATTDGTWQQKGREISYRFQNGQTVYIGNMNDATVSGTAKSGKASWPFGVRLQMGTVKPGPAVATEKPVPMQKKVTVHADDTWVGKRCMGKFAGPKIWERGPKPRIIGEVEAAEITIDKEENGYLFARTLGVKGWVRKSDYIPMEDAIPYFSQRIEQNANDVFAYNQRGILWSERKEYAKALADRGETIRINPKNPVFRHNLAMIYAALNQHDKAIAEFDEAIRLRPEYMLALRWRGLSYFRLKDYDKAMADCDRAIQVNPKFAVLHVDRGNIWSARKEYDKAVADFSEAFRLDSKEALPLRLRGLAHRNLKEFANARADFDQATRVNPKYAQAWSDLAWLLAACRDPQIRDGKRAVAAGEKACQLTNHKTPGYLTVLAAAHAEAGNFKEAIRWQKQTLQFAAYTRSFPNLAKQRLKLYEAGQPFHEK